MKSILLAGVAVLAFGAGVAVAQDMPASTQPAATPAAPATPSPGADPNAGQPTGAVPSHSGMNPAPADVPKDPAAPVGSASNPVTVGGNMTPPPAGQKDYPICSKTVQDSCINPSQAPHAMKKATHRKRHR